MFQIQIQIFKLKMANYANYQFSNICNYNNLEPNIKKMSIYEQITKQIRHILSQSPSQQNLKKSLNNILHNQSPKQCFHQIDLQSIKQSTLVYVKLMVQDIRQDCFTYPYIIEKPLSQKSQIYYFKYGHKEPDFKQEYLQEQEKYYSFLQERQTVACTPVLYETQWVKSLEKNRLKHKIFPMYVQKINEFKLGQVFSAVCIYEPEDKQLYFVRRANESEIKMWQNRAQYLSKQLNFQQTRQKTLALFNKYYSQKYSKFLLYSILSTQHLFISASQVHLSVFEQLLPRVCYVNIKFPFKQSLFPFKNQDQKLVHTPMQMSNEHTFVILDFSQFSQQKQVKISPQQIDNLKALKVYVEQGNTIYRWLYGQSFVPHKNTGLVVKASSIIHPQYIIPAAKTFQKQQKQKISEINHCQGLKSQLNSQISQSDLREIRSYIEQIRKINPMLKDDRQKIQILIHKDGTKFNENSLVKIMELSKLNARSKGKQEITIQDFQHSCQLFF